MEELFTIPSIPALINYQSHFTFSGDGTIENEDVNYKEVAHPAQKPDTNQPWNRLAFQRYVVVEYYLSGLFQRTFMSTIWWRNRKYKRCMVPVRKSGSPPAKPPPPVVFPAPDMWYGENGWGWD